MNDFLARANAIDSVETAPGSVEEFALALRERVKELECLYAISSLREKRNQTPEQFLQSLMDVIPRSWQYPQYASARVVYGEITCTTANFSQGPWKMSADVMENGKTVGQVDVFYAKGIPITPGGPFLKEEHALLRAIAERISGVMQHMKAEAELADAHRTLRAQHQTLQERNITLRSILSTLEDEKREIRSAILANIQKVIMPIVFELELAVSGRQRSYVTLLRQSLQEIASPFLTSITREHAELTPVEIAISAMIRNGMSTKEIAQLRCISPATVRRHRENIRRKLGLQNRRANLVTYLQGSGNPDTGRDDKTQIDLGTLHVDDAEQSKK